MPPATYSIFLCPCCKVYGSIWMPRVHSLDLRILSKNVKLGSNVLVAVMLNDPLPSQNYVLTIALLVCVLVLFL